MFCMSLAHGSRMSRMDVHRWRSCILLYGDKLSKDRPTSLYRSKQNIKCLSSLPLPLDHHQPPALLPAMSSLAPRPGLARSGSSIAAAKKVISLVSGGNAGIGYEIVKKLSQNPDHQVLMGCRDTSKGEAAVATMGAPRNVNPIQLDIEDDESIEHAAKTIEQLFGKLDILINNAGTAGRAGGLDRKPRQIYEEVFSVNVTGAALLTDAMTPLLEKSQAAKVIMITSSLGSLQRVLDKEGPAVPVPWYNASKSAMNYLCVYYAKKYPAWRVNGKLNPFPCFIQDQTDRLSQLCVLVIVQRA